MQSQKRQNDLCSFPRQTIQYDGKAIVGKCDIEENDELTEMFGIMNVPTVVFLKDGKEVDRVVGLAMKNVYQDKLNALL